MQTLSRYKEKYRFKLIQYIENKLCKFFETIGTDKVEKIGFEYDPYYHNVLNSIHEVRLGVEDKNLIILSISVDGRYQYVTVKDLNTHLLEALALLKIVEFNYVDNTLSLRNIKLKESIE